MNELLFDNIKEKDALENLLALNKIKKCDKEIEKYLSEINDLKEEMINILKDEDIDETYVEKIYKYKDKLNNTDDDTTRINEIDQVLSANESRINEFKEKISAVEQEIDSLRKEIFETDNPERVIECQNEVEKNNERLNDLKEILDNLIIDNNPLLIEKEYLTAKISDYDFNVSKEEIKKDLDKITEEFNKCVENLDLSTRENVEFCQKKIANRENEIAKFNDIKNNVINMYPNATSVDVKSAYGEIKDLMDSISSIEAYKTIEETNIFDSIVDEPAPVIDDNNAIFESPIMTEEVEEEPIKEVSIEIPIYDEPSTEPLHEEMVEDEKEDIESVSYELSDGESLANIAEKVYPSRDNWEAIYYFNKDVIDTYLVSNGINNDFETIKELAEDTSLFTGIKLEIPTDFNYKI